jgi:ATP-dependent Lon protease
LLPAQNAKDTVELPKEVLEDLTLYFVQSVGDVMNHLLASGKTSANGLDGGRDDAVSRSRRSMSA